MKEIIKVNTKKQLGMLFRDSALTWEGLMEEDFQRALDECGKEDAKGYHITGKFMNEIFELTGNNAYPDDLNIFAIDKPKVLAMFVGARWFDDIVVHNSIREAKQKKC